MRLAALLDDQALEGSDPVVTGLAIDHRKVAPGTIFGAFVGEKFNGEDFIPAAVDAGAVAIVAATNSGTTARVIARFRPPVPIMAVTPFERTCRQLTLSWGVLPVLSQQRGSTDDIVWFAVKEAVERGLARKDDIVAVLAGDPSDPQPVTDTLRLVRVR